MAPGLRDWAVVIRQPGWLASTRPFSRRRDAVVLGLVAVAILLIPVADLIGTWPRAVELWGHDFHLYLDAASRWLSGGPYYPPEQLTQPMVDDGNRILYPPTALWVFGALAVLPRDIAALIWWAFPVAALTLQIIRLRPLPIVWPFIAICVAWPPTVLTIVVWNSGPLFVAFLALGTLYRWPSALIILKPSVLPFAYWGANHRSWWIAAAIIAVMGVPFGSLWLDWFKVLGNSDQIGGIWHSVQQFPMFLWPILVWLGRSRETAVTIEP